MDGSAAAIRRRDRRGRRSSPRRRRRKYLKVLQVRARRTGPRPRRIEARRRAAFSVDVEIDFEVATIGRQRRAFDIDPQTFRSEIAQGAHLRFRLRRGEACGTPASRSAPRSKIRSRSTASACSIPRACATATNSSATRRSTRSAISRSPARRSSAPITAHRPGHALNAAMLSALFADKANYEFVEGAPPRGAGARRRPRRRRRCGGGRIAANAGLKFARRGRARLIASSARFRAIFRMLFGLERPRSRRWTKSSA